MMDIGVARPKRAGAGNDQHRHRIQQSMRQTRLRSQINAHSRPLTIATLTTVGTKVAGHHIGGALDGRSTALRLGYQSERCAPTAYPPRRDPLASPRPPEPLIVPPVTRSPAWFSQPATIHR
jgi:hypothetical protein